MLSVLINTFTDGGIWPNHAVTSCHLSCAFPEIDKAKRPDKWITSLVMLTGIGIASILSFTANIASLGGQF
jgi:hypothetical protein